MRPRILHEDRGWRGFHLPKMVSNLKGAGIMWPIGRKRIWWWQFGRREKGSKARRIVHE